MTGDTASPPAHARSGRERLPTVRRADPLGDTLARVLGARWRTESETVSSLAERLDERGCATGRVTAARLDELSRAFDRLEAKLNAILVAVTATCVSTLLGLAVYVLRSRGFAL